MIGAIHPDDQQLIQHSGALVTLVQPTEFLNAADASRAFVSAALTSVHCFACITSLNSASHMRRARRRAVRCCWHCRRACLQSRRLRAPIRCAGRRGPAPQARAPSA